jgi:hypothetical protein
MVIGRAGRRASRQLRAVEEFGTNADAVLDILELVEMAWHDCFGDVTPPDDVVDDIFTVAEGSLSKFARAARLAVEDFRDLRMAAQERRS